MTRPLINVPARAKRGQVIEIKTLISHVMEPEKLNGLLTGASEACLRIAWACPYRVAVGPV